DLGRERQHAREALARPGPQHRFERRRERACRIADRRAAAGAAVVEGEDPCQRQLASTRSISARAASSASGSFSGSRPPACAMLSRPPPPPPTTLAATLTISPAFTPRSIAPGVAATSRLALPSPPAPS